MRAIRSGSTFKVWGNGEAKRDYLYTEDFAKFFVALTERQWQGVNVFNVASQEVSGSRLSIEYLPERGVDLSGIEIDCSRAEAELGWKATTELEDGLTKTWEWFVRSK
jgi:nucleoside-diphosphate-sugar epimerase